MHEDDIKALFDRIAKLYEGADEGARGMFSMLVKTVLNYRDDLVNSGKEPLTVAETRDALDAFMKVMKTHSIPADLPPRVHDLVLLWLKELNRKVHN